MTQTIAAIAARRVWDSRGHPTVEVEVRLESGATGRAIAPAGASRGRREAVDLRDGGPRLKGLGVERALANLRGPVADLLAGRDAADQTGIDAALIALDGTPNRGRIGGNAMVAASLAVLQAAAAGRGLPLWAHLAETAGCPPTVPLPEIQIFGGGAHAGGRIDVQDFMVMVPGATSFAEALEITAEIYHAAGAILARKGRSGGVADEGGWWPDFRTNEEGLALLAEAIVAAGETPGGRVVISLDIAASELHRDGVYRLGLERRALSPAEMGALLGGWIDTHAIAAIEDPLGEDDPDGLAAFTAAQGGRVQVIGDDALVTDAALIAQSAARGACNAALIKVNQTGTVTGARAAIAAARAAGWGTIVSARSGETEDVAIAHLATGLGAGQLKVGSFARSERMAKWNECLRIEEALGPGRFAGGAPLAATRWGRQPDLFHSPRE